MKLLCIKNYYMQDDEEKVFTFGKIYDFHDIGQFTLQCIDDSGDLHMMPLEDIIYNFVPTMEYFYR